MDTINYFKIQCLIETIARDRLQQVFKNRWNKEIKVEWVDCIENDIKSNYEYFDLLSKNNQDIITNGKLNLFSFDILSELLLNFKLINQIQEHQENQIIQSLINLNKEYQLDNSTSYKLTLDVFNEFKDKITNYLIQLIDGPDGYTTDELIKDINFKLDTLQVVVCNTLNDQGAKGNTVETEANKIKKRGNKEYNNKEYDKASETWKSALKLQGLSSSTKSVIHLNISSNEFDHSASLTDGKEVSLEVIASCLDYELLIKAEYHAIESIVNRPSFSRSYFKLAKIKSKTSNYQLAIDLCDAATILLELTMVDDPSFASEVEIFKLQTIEKLTRKNSCIDIDDGVAQIDYEKESLIRFEQLDGDTVIKSAFGNQKVTKEFLLKYNIITKGGELKYIDQIDSVSIVKMFEERLYLKAYQFSNCNMVDSTFEILCALFNSNTGMALVYYQISQCILLNRGIEYNEKLYLSFLLKASSILQQTNFLNGSKFGLILIYNSLGMIYRNGLNGEDYDIEKSIYYLNQSIQLDIKSQTHTGYDNPSFLALGYNYLHGYVSNQICKTEIYRNKSKQIWIQGFCYGCDDCLVHYNKHFTPINPLDVIDRRVHQEVTVEEEEECEETDTDTDSDDDELDLDDSNDSEDLEDSKEKLKSKEYLSKLTEIQTIERQIREQQIRLCSLDNLKLGQPLNIQEVKTAADSGSEFAKSIYSTHIKVESFLNLFQEVSTKYEGQLNPSNTYDDEMKLIKSLSSAYRDFGLFWVIRIPTICIYQMKIIINKFLNKDPYLIDARVAWLGLNRLVSNGYDFESCFENFRISKGSIDIANKVKVQIGKHASNHEINYINSNLMVLHYFKIVNAQYVSEHQEIENCLPSIIDQCKSDKEKSAFIYIWLSCWFNVLSSDLKEKEIKYVLDNVNKFESCTPSDDPRLIEIYGSTVLFLIKVGRLDNSLLQLYQKYKQLLNDFKLVSLSVHYDLMIQQLKAVDKEIGIHFKVNN